MRQFTIQCCQYNWALGAVSNWALGAASHWIHVFMACDIGPWRAWKKKVWTEEWVPCEKVLATSLTHAAIYSQKSWIQLSNWVLLHSTTMLSVCSEFLGHQRVAALKWPGVPDWNAMATCSTSNCQSSLLSVICLCAKGFDEKLFCDSLLSFIMWCWCQCIFYNTKGPQNSSQNLNLYNWMELMKKAL